MSQIGTMVFKIVLFLGLVALSYGRIIVPDPRIVNGENAKPGEIPYQVSLQDKSSYFHFCGGSILNKNYIITAAHCVQGKSATSIVVIAGVVDYKDRTHMRLVEKIIVHEKYSPSDSWHNDIALLKVNEAYQETFLVSFVSLPTVNDAVNAKDLAVVSGWGRLWQGGATTNILQRVNIYIADQGYCSDMYKSMGYKIHDSHVCAYDPEVMKGSCHGDSGGPLTVNGKLVGLVSWAKACALTDYPTVYTRVSSFLDWIQEHAV